MPYAIKMNDRGEHCLYKQGDDGEPTGESLGCHESAEMAEKQRKAIYANEGMAMEMAMLFDVQISEFAGQFPDVPLAPGIDMDALKLADPDPLFVTLPVIGEIGAVSKNGLHYDDGLVAMIQDQIINNRPGALFGHIPKDKRDSADPIPAGMWVGARQDGGKLWAKAYIPPGAARDHFRTLKALGRRIATSIWGEGKFEALKDGTKRAVSFSLQSLDFASPERAALGGGHVPIFTAEMTQQGEYEMTRDELIAELKLTDIPAKLREQIVSEATRQDESQATIAELTNTVSAKDTVIAELTQAVEEMRRERVTTAIDAQVAELTDWQVADDAGKDKLAKLRALLRGQIVTRLGDEFSLERVAEIAAAAWDDLKPIAEMMRDALAGPAAVVNGRVVTQGFKPVEDTPENRARAMNQMGIQI